MHMLYVEMPRVWRGQLDRAQNVDVEARDLRIYLPEIYLPFKFTVRVRGFKEASPLP